MTDFDSYAHDYETALNRGLAVSGESRAFFARGRIAWLARCLDGLGFAPHTVLDFGCGTGVATRLFIELLAARSVIGVDVSAASLEVARRTHRGLPVEYRLADHHQPEGTVDLAYCNGVFHHVPPSERPGVARLVADSLRPGGLFALWENNCWNPGTRYVMSRIPFDRDAIPLTAAEARRLMVAAGLSPIRVDYCFIFPRFARVFRFLEPYLTRLPLGAQYQVLAVNNAAANGACGR